MAIGLYDHAPKSKTISPMSYPFYGGQLAMENDISWMSFRSSPIQGIFLPAPSMSLFPVRPVTTLIPDYPGADSEE